MNENNIVAIAMTALFTLAVLLAFGFPFKRFVSSFLPRGKRIEFFVDLAILIFVSAVIAAVMILLLKMLP